MITRFRMLMIACLICAGSSPLPAQVFIPERSQGPGLRQNVYGLGLFGGASSGLGLSFRHHLPGTVSYQITGGIIKVDDKLSSDIGAELQYDLARGSQLRFFMAGGVCYYYSGKSNRNDMDAPWRVGIGVGGEVASVTGIHALFELMFTDFNDGTVLPLPQIGFYYYFY